MFVFPAAVTVAPQTFTPSHPSRLRRPPFSLISSHPVAGPSTSTASAQPEKAPKAKPAPRDPSPLSQRIRGFLNDLPKPAAHAESPNRVFASKEPPKASPPPYARAEHSPSDGRQTKAAEEAARFQQMFDVNPMAALGSMFEDMVDERTEVVRHLFGFKSQDEDEEPTTRYHQDDAAFYDDIYD